MSSDLENWTLDKWLKKLGLRGKYRQNFIDNGYDTPELCANLNKEDLDAIGVTNKHHRSTLFTQSRKLLGLVEKESELASSGDATNTELTARPLPVPFGKANNTAPRNNLVPVSSSTNELDYSEPWNGGDGGSSDPVPLSPTAKSPLHKIKISSDTTDGPGTGRKAIGSGQHISKSPGADLPAYKNKAPTAGLTKLQLKLKIREELFTRGVVLSESPYCMEDGSPDEQLVIDLAAELSDQFEVESLEMYNTLQEVWSYANKTDYATAKLNNKTVMLKPKGKGGKKSTDLHVQPVSSKAPGTDNYDEPFDSASNLTQIHSPIKKVHSIPPKDSNVDNYDEPFDSTSGFTPRLSPTKTKKSATLPAQSPDGCYDEPFDSVPKTSPEKVRRIENTQTLPSPRRQRKSIDSEGSRSPKTSPKGSPGPSLSYSASSSSHKSRFKFLRRKEKRRSQSVLDNDVGLLEDDSKTGKKQAVISFPLATKHVSSENVSNLSVSLDALQLKNGIPPPLPSPRQQKPITRGPSEEEKESSADQPNKGYRKFITPPTLKKSQYDYNSTSSSSSENGTPKFGNKISSKSTVEIDRLSNSSNDEYEGKAWMRASKSYNELRDINMRDETTKDQAKKGKTSRFISRIFKRRTMNSATVKRSKNEKSKTLHPSHRESGVSNEMESISENRERCLTASISMPDITKILEKRSSAIPNRHDSGYAEVFDAIKTGNTYLTTPNFQGIDQTEKKPEKSPRKIVTHKPPFNTNTGSSSQEDPPQHNNGSPPRRTSPVTISHRQMHIRGVSESSAPDHITISIKSVSSMGLDFVEHDESSNSVSTSLGSKPVDSISTISDESNSEDPLSSGNTGLPLSSTGKSQPCSASIRSGSIGSTTSSEISVGSLTKKPPTLPKPHSFATKVKSNSSHAKNNPTVPLTSAASDSSNDNATSTTKLKPSNPPPKPSRSPSRKITSGSSPPNKGTMAAPAVGGMDDNLKSPPSLSSSAISIKPPPKPIRHVHSENIKNISGTNSNITSSSPPPSASVAEDIRKPPPKPSRKGRTLDRNSRTSGDFPLTTTQEGYTNATLPHHFRATERAGSGSPRPVPKPRTSPGTKPSRPVAK